MNISSYGFKSRPEYTEQNPCIHKGFVVFKPFIFNMEEEEKKQNKYRNKYRNETVFFDVQMKKKRYSIPKIYIPKKNGKPLIENGKWWQVYFYWRTDPNGPLDKRFSYQKNINRYTTVKERQAAAKSLQKALLTALDRGWNPITKTSAPLDGEKRNAMTLGNALNYAYKILEKTKSESTLNGYNFHLNRFLEWAKMNGYLGMQVQKFTIDDFYIFYDYIRFEYVNEKTKQGLSGTSVNNHKRSLSSFFGTLQKERIIPANFIKDIPKVDQEPVNNKAFTIEELEKIKKEILKTDPYLIYFLRFMIYPILRPIEICRLKVKDIDTENFYLSVKTKTELLSHRRLIEKIKPTLEELHLENQPASYHVFTNIDKPKDWSEVKLKSRVDHFSLRFRKVKNKLGFGREYSLYSVRHTAILNLYNSMVEKGMGEQEILFKLMPLTAHKSISGIKNYLRKHKKSIPADHSDIYTLDI